MIGARISVKGFFSFFFITFFFSFFFSFFLFFFIFNFLLRGSRCHFPFRRLKNDDQLIYRNLWRHNGLRQKVREAIVMFYDLWIIKKSMFLAECLRHFCFYPLLGCEIYFISKSFFFFFFFFFFPHMNTWYVMKIQIFKNITTMLYLLFKLFVCISFFYKKIRDI